MSIHADLIGKTYRRRIYESIVGRIEFEIEILIDGSFSTTMWVVYSDGFGEEVFTIQEAEEKLEQYNSAYDDL